jgi:predicted DNA-binding protein (MmcQ/YjbR family)
MDLRVWLRYLRTFGRNKQPGAYWSAMDAEITRKYLLKLPHVVETMQWGANLVYWTGDKAIGGKMFALMNLDEAKDPSKPAPVLSFYAGPEQYPLLLEQEGVLPAPYMARIFWVALSDWRVYRQVELEGLLLAAHHGVYDKLPKRVRDTLALPAKQQAALIAARRKLLAARKK